MWLMHIQPALCAMIFGFQGLVRQMCAKAILSQNFCARKIIKTAAFLSKTAVFLVAGAGFEPTTFGL